MTLNFGGNLFPSQREFIQSYDYFDVADGVGYSSFYGLNNNGTLATTTKQNTYSDGESISGSGISVANDNAYDELMDKDFDIVFNVPKTIDGNILVQIPFKVRNSSSTVSTFTLTTKASAIAYHYDGSTETAITSEIDSSDKGHTVGDQDDATRINIRIVTIILPLTNKQHFKAGETLRLTIKVSGKQNSTGSKTLTSSIGTDPANRLDTWNDDVDQQVDSATLKIDVPFVLDI